MKLLISVLWRFRLLTVGGFVAAVALSALSFGQIHLRAGMPQITPRGTQLFQSKATLFITDKRFPWGRNVQEYQQPDPHLPAYAQPQIQVGDPVRFQNLTVLYAKLANSDAVKQVMRESGPVLGAYTAVPVQGIPYSQVSILPLLVFVGRGHTAAVAQTIAERGAHAFHEYLDRQQSAAHIPLDARVVLQLVKRPERAKLISHHSKSVPMVVFLAVICATVGLALLLENLRPRVRPVAPSVASDLLRSA